MTVLINLPQRFQIVNGNRPIDAGVHLLPMLCSAAVGACSIHCPNAIDLTDVDKGVLLAAPLQPKETHPLILFLPLLPWFF